MDIKPEHIASIADSQLTERDNDMVPHRPFGLAAFSPPSQMFDASLALRRAVNHLDLANYEPSTIAPLPSARSKQYVGFTVNFMLVIIISSSFIFNLECDFLHIGVLTSTIIAI